MYTFANMRKLFSFLVVVNEKNHYQPFMRVMIALVSEEIVRKQICNIEYICTLFTLYNTFFNPMELSYTKAISADCLRTYLVTASTS